LSRGDSPCEADFVECKEAFQSFPDSIATGDDFSRGEDEAGVRLLEGDSSLQVSAIQRLFDQADRSATGRVLP
jgi:hypothetical protein